MWVTVFPLVFAHKVKVPVVVFPTSVSPSRRGPSRWIAQWILRRAALVFTRDPLSASAARELGVPEGRVVEVPDIVLGMQPPTREMVDRICHRLGLEPGSFCVVIARVESVGAQRETDLEALRTGVLTALAAPAVTKAAIVDQAGDSDASSALVGVLGERSILVDADLSPAELVALYGGARVTVSSRLHGAIFSLVAGTPAVAVSVDPSKGEGVYASLALPGTWVVNAGDAPAVERAVAEIMDDENGARAMVEQSVARAASELAPLRAKLMSVLTRGFPEGGD